MLFGWTPSFCTRTHAGMPQVSRRTTSLSRTRGLLPQAMQPNRITSEGSAPTPTKLAPIGREGRRRLAPRLLHLVGALSSGTHRQTVASATGPPGGQTHDLQDTSSPNRLRTHPKAGLQPPSPRPWVHRKGSG